MGVTPKAKKESREVRREVRMKGKLQEREVGGYLPNIFMHTANIK